MNQLPRLDELCTTLEKVIAEHVSFDRPLPPKAALMDELHFDSLDLIETSFCIQEYFEFEFSDQNPIERLNQELPNHPLIHEGCLTDLGREITLQRMPELQGLPDKLPIATLQRYFSLETYARLILEFLEATPDWCPVHQEKIELKEHRPRTASGAVPSNLPKGDPLIDVWVKKMVAQMAPSP